MTRDSIPVCHIVCQQANNTVARLTSLIYVPPRPPHQRKTSTPLTHINAYITILAFKQKNLQDDDSILAYVRDESQIFVKSV